VISLLALLLVMVLGLIAGARLEMGSAWAITAFRAGGVIAIIRVAMYWLGLALYRSGADWRQPVGYALLIVNSVVELAIASRWTDTRRGPSLAVAALIVMTSAMLGCAFAWIRVRSESR